MVNFIKRIPIPIAGLALALLALANLVTFLNPVILAAFRIISAILLVLLTLKVIIAPNFVAEDFKNPVILSVAPTYSMAFMLLGAYVKTLGQDTLAVTIWALGIIIHMVFIVMYTLRFIVKFDIKKIFPSIFIVYVGIGTAGITAPAFKMASIGQTSFWFAFISLLILLPVVTYRLMKIKGIPEPASPTFAILAAPASLVLAAYMKSFSDKNVYMVGFLTVLSIVLYGVVIVAMIKLLALKFYPSFSSFTFPMVISGIATGGAFTFLSKAGYNFNFLKYILTAQQIIASVIVLYVLVRYVMFLFKAPQKSEKVIAK